MSGDFYAEWVERHKEEDREGGWWITDEGDPTDGPYTEDDIDAILWEQALDGDALPSPL